MTSGDTPVVSETSDDTNWVVYNLAGRDIPFLRPSPEQLMVLRKLARQLGDPAQSNSKQIIGMGKVLDAISACMVNEDDVDYADNLVLERKVEMEALTPMIVAVLTGNKAEAPKTGPTATKRVRRR